MAHSIRPCSAADLARLLEPAADPGDARHHQERFGRQEAGLATYLVAWRGGEPAGRCTVLAAVRRAHGCLVLVSRTISAAR